MHNHNHDDEQNLAALLDLDAEVLGPQLAEATAWLAALAGDRPVRRILDLGCGTGAGTFALLERFPDADVIAVDLSPHMLRQLEAKARARGLAVRVRTVEANLDEDWPPLDGDVDLAWMSAALHHMSDPARTLRQALAAVRPGGLLGLIEMQGFPRFLPDDIGLGRPGLEARCNAVVDRLRAVELPHHGADWAPMLEAAGFAVASERQFTVELTPPLTESAGRYAQAVFQRLRPRLDGELDSGDLAVLDTLIGDGPESLRRRADLTVRGTRPAWAGRRLLRTLRCAAAASPGQPAPSADGGRVRSSKGARRGPGFPLT